eukprot:6184559-Pleurochrysis_carterae.AAC.3
MAVSFDVAALSRDGVFRFDEAKADLSGSSKRHMKFYLCGQLRGMLDGLAALDAATARDLRSPQQLVQVNRFLWVAQCCRRSCNSGLA